MERRDKAMELIQNREMQGYLAYEDGIVIGWCNVNDRKNYRYLMTMFEEIINTLENSSLWRNNMIKFM